MVKRKFLVPLSLAVVLLVFFAGSASASTIGVPSKTTLDACGYFYGNQTPSHVHSTVHDGVTHSAEHGTWNGVYNNYYNTPVVSVSPVVGTYFDAHSKDAAGNIRGIERFRSPKGSIDQHYAYSVATGWQVSVAATGQLSFLTSNTNGHCYTGPFPRP